MRQDFLRYVLVGGCAFVIDFSTLAGLTEYAGLHYLAAASIAFMLGLVTNYVLCIFWVFDHRAITNRYQEFVIFAAIGLVGLVANDLVMLVLTDGLGFQYLLSKIFAAGTIMLMNYTLRRNILFTKRCNPT